MLRAKQGLRDQTMRITGPNGTTLGTSSSSVKRTSTSSFSLPEDTASATSKLLADYDVVDLTIEDAPLEEVMRDLFGARVQEARGLSRAQDA